MYKHALKQFTNNRSTESALIMDLSDDSSISSDEMNMMARNIDEEAREIVNNLLPIKSSERYRQCFSEFEAWRTKNNITSYEENTFLVYFNELSKKQKPSSLWNKWSMIKSVLQSNYNININTYQRLKTFIKNKAKGYNAKKAKVFKWEEIMQFLTKAENRVYLHMKVILIFGICGALRTVEFCNLITNDVEDTGKQFIVSIRDTKNCYPRSFIIGSEFYEIVKKYMNLRPKDTETNRFFIFYSLDKCTKQPIGKTKISETPRNIACYLNLSDSNSYTGHCFRRTSATLLANSGATLTTVKQHGGWKSSSVAEGYIENSLHNRKNIYNKIINSEKDSSNFFGNVSATVTTNSTSTPVLSTSTTVITKNPKLVATSSETTADSINEELIPELTSTNEYSIEISRKKVKYSNDTENNNPIKVITENQHSHDQQTSSENIKCDKSLNFNLNAANKFPLQSIENNPNQHSTKSSTSKSTGNSKSATNNEFHTKTSDNIVINIKIEKIEKVIINYNRKFDEKEDN